MVGLVLGVFVVPEDGSTTARSSAENAAAAEAIREAFAEFEESRSATTVPPLEAIEAARAEVAEALRALEDAAAKDLQAELARIEKAAENEAAEARALLVDFRGQVVAYWEDYWAEQQLPGDSLEATLVTFRESSMLREIDFALSSVGLNVESARLAAENAARRAADARLNKVTDRYYVCMAVDEASGYSAEGVAACGMLVELGPPEWPPHDWTCVQRDVQAVLSMRPDDYTPFDADTGAQKIDRIFGCLGLELG